MFKILLIALPTTIALACGPGTDRSARTPGASTTTGADSAVDPARLWPLDSSSDLVVVPGACPFECCQYGNWITRTTAGFRRVPSLRAPIFANLAPNTQAVADSGVVVVRPGIVVGVADFRDRETGLSLRQGDTLYLLEEQGEGFFHARLFGRSVTVSMWDLDEAGTHGAKVIRGPEEQWWAHLTIADTLRGWVFMNEVSVNGADACGS